MRPGPQMKSVSGSFLGGTAAPALRPRSAPARLPSSDDPTGCISISRAARRGEIPRTVVSGPPRSSPSVASNSSLSV